MAGVFGRSRENRGVFGQRIPRAGVARDAGPVHAAFRRGVRLGGAGPGLRQADDGAAPRLDDLADHEVPTAYRAALEVSVSATGGEILPGRLGGFLRGSEKGSGLGCRK